MTVIAQGEALNESYTLPA